MKYRLETRLSPNYTLGSQSQAFYGRVREILFGAGHWWGLWQSGFTHQGVVNTFLNPARQGSAHEVISDGRVTVMVQKGNIAWATNNANPYTYSYEVDPQIMHKWRSGATAAQKAKANRIFETVAQRMADTNMHNYAWHPHKKWWNTACNDIRWNEIVARAKQIKAGGSAPASRPVPASKLLSEGKLKFRAKLATTSVWDLTTNPNYKAATTLKKGEIFEAIAYIDFNNSRYYVTEFSHKNGKKVGVNRVDVDLIAPDPEWIKNLVDIADVKLFVTPAAGTLVYDLNTGKALPESVIAKGTAIDIAKKTIVGGRTYLLSNYAVKNAKPHGILEGDLAVPAEPPKQEKPEWLKNLKDIEDVVMYTRAEVPLVNLLDGSTVKMLPINTPIDVATFTTWHDQDYFITQSSTEAERPYGIKVVDLDKDPIKAPEQPIEPAPEQPSLDPATRTFLELLGKLISDFLAKFKN